MGRDDENKKNKVGVEGRIIVDKKAKGPWDYRARFLGEDTFSAGVLGGFSWPPRSYTCSFCKRVFKSAQALGGHMNVHRRERALLRQSPPWAAQTSNPHNPNPNLSSSSFHPSQSFSHNCFTLSPPPPPSSHEVKILELPSAQSNDPSCSNSDGLRRRNSLKALFNIEELKGFVVERDGENILKRSDLVSLDLEIGLHRNSKDDDLDLELRLGYS